MKIRKEICNKTTDVQVKQLTLQDKQEKERKVIEYPKKGRNFPFHSEASKKRDTSILDC